MVIYPRFPSSRRTTPIVPTSPWNSVRTGTIADIVGRDVEIDALGPDAAVDQRRDATDCRADRIDTETARFTYPEAKIGFSGGLISAIVARIPHKVARGFIFLGEALSARRAYEDGFVNQVVAGGQHMEAAMEYADKLKTSTPLVLAMLKRFTSKGMK